MSQQETNAIRDQLRRLIDNTPNEPDRAGIQLAMVQACYDATKFTFPAGGGLDGRDGPERDEIAAIVGQAHRRGRWTPGLSARAAQRDGPRAETVDEEATGEPMPTDGPPAPAGRTVVIRVAHWATRQGQTIPILGHSQ